LLLGEARRRGVPTAVWGHALGRQVASNEMAALRRRMFAMAGTIICYCYAEQGPLQKLFPGKHILVAGNSTVRVEECAPLETSFGQRSSVLFLGRLVEAKKPILLLKAVHLAQQRGIQIGATFVGDGPQLDKCERFVAAHRVKGVLFAGAQFEREKLRSLASSCFVMASPGYVGLSVLDAMSCGLPVAYSPSEPNSPEVEVLQEGGNALAFASDSAESLVDCLLRFYADRDGWLSRGEHYVEEVRSKYSIERMTKQFIRFFRQDGLEAKKLC
jgi:glycosyltransferase involved in cell wall biosynthesis